MSEANGNCVGGRPYRVDGVARVAEVVRSEAWLLQPLAMVETSRVLTSEERETLSLAWGIDASTEHASIASFARFALELLAVGAPSHLLAGASEAMRDEIAHARACYAIATRFAGSPMGPGALGTDAPAAQDLASITRACVLEGCIGETVAALRAERALVHVIDEEVRETLSMIVRDEGRHAELAWQFVRWAIAEGGEQIERVVAEAFEEARPRRSTVALDETPRFMAEYGQLGAREQRDVEEAAWRMVIEPCRAQLTAASPEQVASLS